MKSVQVSDADHGRLRDHFGATLAATDVADRVGARLDVKSPRIMRCDGELVLVIPVDQVPADFPGADHVGSLHT